MSKLRIADGLTLPIETTTQAIGIVAKRRVGKSYTARRIAEQLFKADQQIVIVDPKGDWWGIRSAADGKSPGLPVVILGGERGDVPLEVGAGEVVAKLVTDERVSVLLDLSLFRKREVATFMTSFLENLYRLKAREALRTPLMLIIDEADAIAPQKPQEGEERMLGAAEDIVRRGGQRGIGCMMITQRTAVLNKNVLTQCEMLVALRTIAPQDLKAMQAWIDVHGTLEERDELMASLPSLPQGDAWFWSPGWPSADGIFKRVHVLPIETFDSGATPKAGEKRVEPKRAADVDLDALRRQMAATIEKAKAEDPKLLQKRIRELESQVAKQERVAAATTPATPEQLQSAREDGARVATQFAAVERAKELTAIESTLGAIVHESLIGAPDRLKALILDVQQMRARELAIAPSTSAVRSSRAPSRAEPRPQPARVERVVPRRVEQRADGVTPAMQRILDALAAFEPIGITPVRRVNAAFFAGYTENGHFNNMLGTLRTMGLVDYPQGGTIALTNAGRAAASPDAAPISSLDELHSTWLGKVSSAEAKLLRVLIERYPQEISRAQLAEATGYTENGHFNNMLGHLRALGAADYPRGSYVAATDVLFPEGLS